MSSSVSVKSSTSALDRIRCSCTDLGMTTTRCCRCQRMMTCAGVRPSALGDRDDRGVLEGAAAQRAVALEDHAAFPVTVQHRAVEQQRAPLHLVHRGRHAGLAGELVDLLERVVAHPDVARQPLLAGLAERPPDPDVRGVATGPVDQPQVDPVGAQQVEAGAQRRQLPAGVAGRALGRDEHVVAGDTAGGQPGADLLLVAVDRWPCRGGGSRRPVPSRPSRWPAIP